MLRVSILISIDTVQIFTYIVTSLDAYMMKKVLRQISAHGSDQ